jgi:hypothetical protein
VRLWRLTAEVIEVPMTTGIEKRLDKYFWSAWGRIRQEEISRPWRGDGKSIFQNIAEQIEPQRFYDGECKMTITRELIHAILSMDAYNRGYGFGVYLRRHARLWTHSGAGVVGCKRV